jgi:hypothetical protein
MSDDDTDDNHRETNIDRDQEEFIPTLQSHFISDMELEVPSSHQGKRSRGGGPFPDHPHEYDFFR